MSRPQNWSMIAETGTTLGIRILIAVFRIGGRMLFKFFLFPVICFYFILRSDSRAASANYLRRVGTRVEHFPSVTTALKFRHFWNFGIILIDKFAVWMGKLTREDIVVKNGEIIEQCLNSGRGGVFAISHLGNFEVLSALSSTHRGVKLTVIHHTRHAEKFNQILHKYYSTSQVEFIQVTELDAGVAMKLSERVERGEFIAIAADRVPVSNDNATISCQFLGSEARFPRGPYILSQILRAPLILCVAIREQGRYNIYFESLPDGRNVSRARREKFILIAAQAYVERLERYVIKAPLQWFNFYHFWQHDVS